jgi:predicted HTH domain antitoxin
MTIELPDPPAGEQLTAEEMRLELACALYARGRIGKVAATEMAGVDFFTFQRALSERGVPLYTQQMLASDIQSLSHFSRPPSP